MRYHVAGAASAHCCGYLKSIVSATHGLKRQRNYQTNVDKKPETRNQKSEGNPKPEIRSRCPMAALVRASGFGHSFGFLVSDFGLAAPCRRQTHQNKE
jgi:hypothetical protein